MQELKTKASDTLTAMPKQAFVRIDDILEAVSRIELVVITAATQISEIHQHLFGFYPNNGANPSDGPEIANGQNNLVYASLERISNLVQEIISVNKTIRGE